jgi:hypothetical protein
VRSFIRDAVRAQRCRDAGRARPTPANPPHRALPEAVLERYVAPRADRPIHATSRRTLRSAGVIRCSAPRGGDQRALDHLAASGHVFDDVDIERLSPLGGDHITLTGRYRFTL